MIHLQIKQDYASTKNNLIVSDKKGRECYLIVGKWGRIGDGFSLFGIGGDLIIEVKQTTLSLFPKFNLMVAGKKIATIKKYRGLKGPYFKVRPLAWSIKGDFDTKHYWVKKGRKTIMEMEKTYVSFGDSYTVSIDQQTNVPICLCLAVIVDNLAVTREPTKIKQLKKQAIQLT
ncbi:LURP-one-related/scramblase family protein [Carnobacterium sp. TMP28]|uniref:LURP-one-related/scramblase family protein n=1 Tax=Carnobacterium sp. TMP28 TaxID=3397060 RepID=UPI0039E01494